MQLQNKIMTKWALVLRFQLLFSKTIDLTFFAHLNAIMSIWLIFWNVITTINNSQPTKKSTHFLNWSKTL